MKFFLACALVLALLSVVTDATGVVTVAVGAATASTVGVALLAKGVVLKGFLAGSLLGSKVRSSSGSKKRYSSYRKGRSVGDDLTQVFLEANKADQDDCAKMLVCETNAKADHLLNVSTTVIVYYDNVNFRKSSHAH